MPIWVSSINYNGHCNKYAVFYDCIDILEIASYFVLAMTSLRKASVSEAGSNLKSQVNDIALLWVSLKFINDLA